MGRAGGHVLRCLLALALLAAAIHTCDADGYSYAKNTGGGISEKKAVRVEERARWKATFADWRIIISLVSSFAVVPRRTPQGAMQLRVLRGCVLRPPHACRRSLTQRTV